MSAKRRRRSYRKKGRVKPHRKIRHNCKKCGRSHSRHEHASHGYGSYRRIHG